MNARNKRSAGKKKTAKAAVSKMKVSDLTPSKDPKGCGWPYITTKGGPVTPTI